jgi:hypothetical protein
MSTSGKPKGFIRYVLLVISLPVEPTPPQTFAFLNKILPELETQQDGTAKIAKHWVTTPMSSIDMAAVAAEAFGNEVVNNSIYDYRTLHLGLNGGEAKCLVVYDKTVAAPSSTGRIQASAVSPKKWWQFGK